jgi:hypothetical protein
MYRKILKYFYLGRRTNMGHFDQGRCVVYVSVPEFNPGIRKTKMEECEGPDVRGRGREGEVGVAPHPH